MTEAPRRLNAVERRIRSAFRRGVEVDLRAEATQVRAAVIADLLTRPVDRAAYPRAALRLQYARIVGPLDLGHVEIPVPVSFKGSTFTDAPDLSGARAVNLLLADCVLPGLQARLLRLDGDLSLQRCEVTGPIDLHEANIGGGLTLDDSHLSRGARTPVEDRQQSIMSQVTLAGARMTIGGDLHARAGFTAEGQVWLDAAQVGGNVDFDGASLRSSEAPALNADRLSVVGSFTARHGFNADGEVILTHAYVGGQLNFINAELRTSGLWALHLGGARVSSLWLMFTAPPVGRVRLSGLHADAIFDDPRTWPATLDLIGCAYQTLTARSPTAPGTPSPPIPVTVQQRLEWLRRSPDGYAPQPYEQLADTYRRNGQEPEARRVLLEKQRQRRAALRLPSRLPGYVLDGLVGYGYRTWLAGVWLTLFWAVGTITFILQPSVPRNPADAPHRNPALQALDLLLPIVNLGYDDAWKPTGATTYVAVLLVMVGWVLTAAIAAGLTRVFNR